ncbi:UNVERIFIED_CONTAM: hypothetical protein FKN15_012366 [Acipenser sinensis]
MRYWVSEEESFPAATLRKKRGKGGKNRRRGKNENESEKRELVFKEDGQEYAQVIKMLGNGRLEATCFDGVKRLCHIRGKLRKKVWINASDIILVGLRDYQDNKADVILKYNADEARSLKAYGELPEHAKINETDTFGPGDDDEIQFDDIGDDDEDIDDSGIVRGRLLPDKWNVKAVAREQQIQQKEKRAQLQYERQMEERWRRLEEQRQKEELRRAAVEEKRRQRLEEEKIFGSKNKTPPFWNLVVRGLMLDEHYSQTNEVSATVTATPLGTDAAQRCNLCHLHSLFTACRTQAPSSPLKSPYKASPSRKKNASTSPRSPEESGGAAAAPDMLKRASVNAHPESAKKKAEREKGDGAAAQDRRAEEARGTEKPDRKMTKSESSDIGASEASPVTPTGKTIAGTTDAEEASKLLAERRRQARLQKEREEQEKREQEEAERVKAEELRRKMAEERARQEEAARQAEEERRREEERRQKREEEERLRREQQDREMQAQLEREATSTKLNSYKKKFALPSVSWNVLFQSRCLQSCRYPGSVREVSCIELCSRSPSLQREEAELKAQEAAERFRQEREQLKRQVEQERLQRKKVKSRVQQLHFINMPFLERVHGMFSFAFCVVGFEKADAVLPGNTPTPCINGQITTEEQKTSEECVSETSYSKMTFKELNPVPPLINLNPIVVKSPSLYDCTDEVQSMDVSQNFVPSSPVSKEELISIPEFSPINEIHHIGMSNAKAIEDLLDLTGHMAYPMTTSETLALGDLNKNLIEGFCSSGQDSQLIESLAQSIDKASLQ